MMIQNVRLSIHNTLHWLVLPPMLLLASCAGSDSEEAHDTPALSDIPVSFTALSKWDDAKTRLQENSDNSVSFEKDDQIGIFAYYNYSTTPNFMNNQLATCNTSADGTSTSWSYSPTKYWPANEKDELSFYAYYPYHVTEDKTISVSSTSETPLAIEYNCSNADIDLMVSEAQEKMTYEKSAGDISLNFKHLLARVRFTFTYTGGDSYHPVIHVLKYTIPRYKSSIIPYIKANGVTKLSTDWNISDKIDTMQVVRHVTNVAGVILNKEGLYVPEFTAYLLPGEFPYSEKTADHIGDFIISLNNRLYSYRPSEIIKVEAGKSYTINFNIAKTNSSKNYFITSYSMWEDSGVAINGTLQ